MYKTYRQKSIYFKITALKGQKCFSPQVKKSWSARKNRLCISGDISSGIQCQVVTLNSYLTLIYPIFKISSFDAQAMKSNQEKNFTVYIFYNSFKTSCFIHLILNASCCITFKTTCLIFLAPLKTSFLIYLEVSVQSKLVLKQSKLCGLQIF